MGIQPEKNWGFRHEAMGVVWGYNGIHRSQVHVMIVLG